MTEWANIEAYGAILIQTTTCMVFIIAMETKSAHSLNPSTWGWKESSEVQGNLPEGEKPLLAHNSIILNNQVELMQMFITEEQTNRGIMWLLNGVYSVLNGKVISQEHEYI